ncbi:hypothetical protein Rpal_4356 [Rhodopseudomonas palustris TIE-1]|uniref:AbiU2 domain-containing protein n=1 Tax=Rhodopseudomonas palustris TaxID=1076 RepID=UPI0001779872|nr:hypothetical protein [Rhodopseudomonas palustris]ACF02852.1 hypothetical protein Rpal_4356 [Rhodopseudomonas palustris TIE-1]
MRIPLNQRLDRIGQHIVRARLFFDLWIYFEGEQTRSKIIRSMRRYNEFFRFAPHAFFVSYVIYIAGVFDGSEETISFNWLIPEVRKEGRLSAEDDRVINDLLQQAGPIVAKIKILRHKAIAHRDARISYDDAFKMAEVTPDQLREVTELALEMVNHLYRVRGMQNQSFTELPREAAEGMMRALA